MFIILCLMLSCMLHAHAQCPKPMFQVHVSFQCTMFHAPSAMITSYVSPFMFHVFCFVFYVQVLCSMLNAPCSMRYGLGACLCFLFQASYSMLHVLCSSLTPCSMLYGPSPVPQARCHVPSFFWFIAVRFKTTSVAILPTVRT